MIDERSQKSAIAKASQEETIELSLQPFDGGWVNKVLVIKSSDGTFTIQRKDGQNAHERVLSVQKLPKNEDFLVIKVKRNNADVLIVINTKGGEEQPAMGGRTGFQRIEIGSDGNPYGYTSEEDDKGQLIMYHPRMYPKNDEQIETRDLILP